MPSLLLPYVNKCGCSPRGFIGLAGKKMETTINVVFIVFFRVVRGFLFRS